MEADGSNYRGRLSIGAAGYHDDRSNPLRRHHFQRITSRNADQTPVKLSQKVNIATLRNDNPTLFIHVRQ